MSSPLRRRAAAAALTLGCGAVLLTAGPAAAAAQDPAPGRHADAAEGGTPLDLASARLSQFGEDAVRLELRTVKPFVTSLLVPGSGRSLCLQLRIGGHARPDERVCAISTPAGLRLRRTTLDRTGAERGIRNLSVPVIRPDGRTLAATVPFTALGLRYGTVRWDAYTHWQDVRTCRVKVKDISPCTDHVPDRGSFPVTLAPLKVTGCEFHGAQQVSRGSAAGNRIALTFDDGPASITSRFLDLLEHEHVPATFFVVGNAVAGHEALLRRMLAGGSMIGNHSYTHSRLDGGGAHAASEISRTQDRIRAATGFTPCLFRPPYGATSSALVAVAGAQRLTSVLWDVDPSDYRRPGAGVIESRVESQSHAGSIVLSHDGGGPREQTLQAVRGEIRTFKKRGYHFVTVDELLGLDLVRG